MVGKTTKIVCAHVHKVTAGTWRMSSWVGPGSILLIAFFLMIMLSLSGLAQAEEHSSAAVKSRANSDHGAVERISGAHENTAVEENAGHQLKHLDNWFSLSFGANKPHQNGPFAFALLNFILFVWLLIKFAREPLRDYLHNRHTSIRRDLQEAAALHQHAREKLSEIEDKLKNIEHEIAEMKEKVARDAQLEKERIIHAAEEEAERIIMQADQTLNAELRRARRQLEVEAVNAALEAAEKMIRQHINESDRKGINEGYFSQISDERLSRGGKRGGTN